MAVIRSQNKYRKREWLDQIFGQLRAEILGKQELKRWLPSEYIFLRDALNIWGIANIPEWSGEEQNARKYSEPPDPPWLWRLSEGKWDAPEDKPRYIIFNESNEKVFVTEREAKDWWEKIKPDLIEEWKAGNQAHQRWIECKKELREHLYKNDYVAHLMDDQGEIYKILPKVWLSADGDTILNSGIASLRIPKNQRLIEIKGPVVFLKDFMDPKLKPEQQEQKKPQNNLSNINNFPYLIFMIKAIQEIPFEKEGRTPKKIIEGWLRDNWPENLGKATETKIKTMATFLRRPEDETGGVHGKVSDS